ncbi:hypothetical protein PAL_GLEAN10007900 [Pteropus alecto]|uniref:Uncharacterized protein n=1 Tax=Pteropus alecto TaxID=9402 RepID=L5L6G3_PTEAL|nr:hypothetical protein PAL_GLEAN10007900 [Pteropus alecto]
MEWERGREGERKKSAGPPDQLTSPQYKFNIITSVMEKIVTAAVYTELFLRCVMPLLTPLRHLICLLGPKLDSILAPGAVETIAGVESADLVRVPGCFVPMGRTSPL